MWSVLSLIALLGGIGLLLAIYGRYPHLLGWQGMEERRLQSFRRELPLTPAQRSTAWYFFAVAALLLAQTLLGGATAHYHAEDGSFFGLDLARVLPYNLARTWHLQLALFWIRRVPRGRHFWRPDRRARAKASGSPLLCTTRARWGRGRQPRR